MVPLIKSNSDHPSPPVVVEDRSGVSDARQFFSPSRLANVRTPVAIDVRRTVWGVEDDAPFCAIISLNMVHIAPWEAALELLAGAGRLLRPDGVLFFYGPFMLGGRHTAPSNAPSMQTSRGESRAGACATWTPRRRGGTPRA